MLCDLIMPRSWHSGRCFPKRISTEKTILPRQFLPGFNASPTAAAGVVLLPTSAAILKIGLVVAKSFTLSPFALFVDTLRLASD